MTAVISDCGCYRYRLERTVKETGWNVSILMVNPSTADAIENDATIRKLIGFGHRLGWQRFTVGNLFAFRATDVSDLASAADPVGPLNNGHLLAMMMQTDLTVIAWGSLAKLPPKYRNEWRKVWAMAQAVNRPLYCFGIVADGHPKHPCMIAYSTIMPTWKPPL